MASTPVSAVAAPGLSVGMRRLLGSPLAAILATPHGVDRYLELVNPLWSVDEVRAEVVEIIREAGAATTLRLRPNRNWQGFRAGQYVRISSELAGIRRTRCYSLSSSTQRQDGLVDITIKTLLGGRVSGPLSTLAHPGMIVTLSQAEGDFTLPARLPAHVLFVSGGSGITPCMSMLRTLVDMQYAGVISILHYAPSDDEVIFGAELAAIAAANTNVTLQVVSTRATSASAALRGHFSAAHLDAALPALTLPSRRKGMEDFAAYVCGPQTLIDAVQGEFSARGLTQQLHVERFIAQTPAPLTEAMGGEVTFVRSGHAVTSDGRSLLAQAEAAGLQPESGCRMGICMSCTCTKASGITKNTVTGELSTEPNEEIRLCVSVPVGDVSIAI